LYSVDDKYYLEGPLNEELLKSQVTCQYFDEEADEWFAATILNRTEINVPHTALTLKKFTMSYVDDQGAVKRADGIRSDKLRLYADKDGHALDKDGHSLLYRPPVVVPSSSSSSSSSSVDLKSDPGVTVLPPQPVVINEATGISTWSTVSVRVIDEEEEERLKELREAEELEARLLKAKLKRDREVCTPLYTIRAHRSFNHIASFPSSCYSYVTLHIT
jgi:hypothetical protein